MKKPHRKQREITLKLRRQLIQMKFWIVVALLVFLWAAAALRYFKGIDLLNRKGEPWSIEFYFWAAALGSIAGVAWGFWSIRRDLFLAEYGLEVTATVTSVSGMSARGMVPVRYAYSLGVLKCAGADDLLESDAAELSVGSPLRLLVDPRRPRKSKPYDDVLPARFASEVRPIDASSPASAPNPPAESA
jgi:hypothetical protein